MIIAHVSDLHFGDALTPLLDGLAQRLSEIRPDLIVASGDFTMRGTPAEFAAAERYLVRLGRPIVATPGNHDIPAFNLFERFVRPLRRYRASVGAVTMESFASGAAAIVSVNSARPWDLTSLNWSHGRVSKDQIGCVRRFFGEADSAAFRAVVVHHPLVLPEDPLGFRVLSNGQALLDALGGCGVHAVMSGHFHRQYQASRSVPLGDSEHEVRLLQVSSAASTRLREQPNAFAVIDTSRSPFEVRDEVWDGERFVSVNAGSDDEHFTAERP